MLRKQAEVLSLSSPPWPTVMRPGPEKHVVRILSDRQPVLTSRPAVFLRDRQTQLSLGVLVATSVSAVMVLRSGHRDGDGAARLLTPAIRFADHLSLAQDDVEQYGQDSTRSRG